MCIRDRLGQYNHIQNTDNKFLINDEKHRDNAVEYLYYLRDHLPDYLPQNEYYTGEEMKRYNQEALNKLNRLIEMNINYDTYYEQAMKELEEINKKSKIK